MIPWPPFHAAVQYKISVFNQEIRAVDTQRQQIELDFINNKIIIGASQVAITMPRKNGRGIIHYEMVPFNYMKAI